MRPGYLLIAATILSCTAVRLPAQELVLNLRSRVETDKGSERYNTVVKPAHWDASKTAIIVCDMWDKHWSTNASKRVAEMAPRMNEVLEAARKKGVFIIHCPSDTMDFYKGTPQRERARQAPRATPKVPLENWCRLDPKREPPLPIDDSDGGDDTLPPCKQRRAWSRQIETLRIAPEDAITDNAEAYNLLEERGITNVIVMGVHANMCVLGRPFAIRQLVKQGKNVVLARDLTDTMYNPARPPFVSHFTGTDLIIEHIEAHWCPTCTSADLIRGKPFRFKDDVRPTLAIVMAEDEYQTEKTLPAFARQQLGKDFRVQFVFGKAKEVGPLTGLEILDEADVALFSVRRRALPTTQMDIVRSFVKAGKPVVGIRTASHAFAPRGNAAVKEGLAYWATFDRDVLGCHYANHYGQDLQTYVSVVPGESRHPIVLGLTTDEVPVRSWLYKVKPLAEGAIALVNGRAGDRAPAEPVAWIWSRPDGGRVFSTTLGHPDDFTNAVFVRLLRNGTHWAAGLPIPTEVSRTAPVRP
jgi:nicotinamidase-related amidase/type 1 glutamine amidotransferase